MNGADHGLKLCLDCHRVCIQNQSHCTGCGSRVETRRKNSLTRCWALTLTAGVLYIPANVLPMMTVSQLNQGQPETILSGVIELVNHGMIPIAILVFTASILVPVFKLIGMTWLLLNVHWGYKNTGIPRRRIMQLYRFILWIGRWSMLDIFIISLLAGIVQFGKLGQVTAGAGAYAFAVVVVITMFAAISFDPRLLWDADRNKSAEPVKKRLHAPAAEGEGI